MPASCSVLLSVSRWRRPRWRSTRIRSHDGQEEVPRNCDGRRPRHIPGHAQEVRALLRHAQVRQLEYRFSIRTGYWLSSGCGCFLRNSVGARSIFQLWSCTTSSPLFVKTSPQLHPHLLILLILLTGDRRKTPTRIAGVYTLYSKILFFLNRRQAEEPQNHHGEHTETPPGYLRKKERKDEEGD